MISAGRCYADYVEPTDLGFWVNSAGMSQGAERQVSIMAGRFDRRQSSGLKVCERQCYSFQRNGIPTSQLQAIGVVDDSNEFV